LLLLAQPGAAITGGQPDDGLHPYVGVVFNDEILCSGTLIAPTVFLTAAHCTADFEQSGTPVFVTFDPFPGETSIYIQADAWYTHPDFCLDCAPGLPGFDTYDVGVVILSEAVTDVGFASLPEPGLLDGLDLKSERFTIVGYGVQEFSVGGGPPEPSAAATRFYATVRPINIRDRVGDMFLKQSANKGGTCFGDSGGPTFLTDQTTIVAVTSFVTNGLCRGVTYSQRVDRADILSFIEQFL
jgi:hypothetical protein